MNLKIGKLKIVILYIFDIIPFWLAKLISRITLKLLKWEKDNDFYIVEKKTNSIKDLIILDFDCAVGDGIVSIYFLKEIDSKIKKIDVIINEKFEPIFKLLNFKNINIIYRKSTLGTHYKYSKIQITSEYFDKLKDDVSKLDNSGYNKVYYMNISLKLDSMFLLSMIKYNELIKFYPYGCVYKRNSLFLRKRSLPYSLFFLINKKMFKIKENKNKLYWETFISDWFYYMYFNKLPTFSLNRIEVNLFNKNEYVSKNSLIIMIDDAKQNKRLKPKYLFELLVKKYQNYIITFVGNGPKFLAEFNKININNELKIVDKINKTPDLLSLFKEVNDKSEVLAYDTSILHIAMMLNKKTFLIVNKNNEITKKTHNVWQNYKKDNLNILKLNNKYFY